MKFVGLKKKLGKEIKICQPGHRGKSKSNGVPTPSLNPVTEWEERYGFGSVLHKYQRTGPPLLFPSVFFFCWRGTWTGNCTRTTFRAIQRTSSILTKKERTSLRLYHIIFRKRPKDYDTHVLRAWLPCQLPYAKSAHWSAPCILLYDPWKGLTYFKGFFLLFS